MWMFEDYYPLGFPGQNAFRLTLGGLGAAFGLGFLRFLSTYHTARGELYQTELVNNRVVRTLIDGAMIAPFPTLLDGVSLFLVLVALCLVGAIFLHYSWHWMGGRNIYRMRLLPHRRELWRRVLTIPLAGLAACVILWGLLLLLCALTYRYGTPDGHLPPNCWGSFPFYWIGGCYA